MTTAGSATDLSNSTLGVQTAVTTSDNPPHGGLAVQTVVTTNTKPAKGTSNKQMMLQTAVATNVAKPDVQQGFQPDVEADV